MTSTRHDGDSWDLASSVGATATMVAAARARATRAERPLISDPFAEPLVRAVGIDLLVRLATGEDTADATDSAAEMEQALIDAATVRTKFYDEYFLAAANAGIAQVVILAAGLDSRAYRLDWPAGTVVYEVDQPQVIEFKTRTLGDLGAAPAADLRVAPADLRDDWPAALRGAGFDPARPTAWSAEGLLGYLPAQAQDRLLDTITELSAPGSRVATENTRNRSDGDEHKMKDRMHAISARWGEQGFDPDMANLRYFGERNEASKYLDTLGWSLTGSALRDLLADNALPVPEEGDMRILDQTFVSGVLEPGAR
ncbi:MAG: class I SAM-dependent methyltransferase [Nocardia sp.]|nr:class I SAM-dependent methyltransferase [Nocardia sp.]